MKKYKYLTISKKAIVFDIAKTFIDFAEELRGYKIKSIVIKDINDSLDDQLFHFKLEKI